WAVALLQTAAFLVGGWSILYAFRRWFAGRSKSYAGHFTYFDPLFVYEVEGEMVRLIDLYGVKSITAVKMAGAGIEFDYGNGRTELVKVGHPRTAQAVEEY